MSPFPHPFVTIYKQEGTSFWWATWMEPGTKKLATKRFRDIGIITAEARKAWAIQKSGELSRQHARMRGA